MNIDYFEKVMQESEYKLKDYVEDYGDYYDEDSDDYLLSSMKRFIKRQVLDEINPLEFIVEYKKTNGEIISSILGNTIISSYISDRTDYSDNIDVSEYNKYIYIEGNYMDELILKKLIYIHNNPLEAKITLLDAEKKLLEYIKKHFTSLFDEAELVLESIDHVHPYTDKIVDDTYINYSLKGSIHIYSTYLQIKLNSVTEDIEICLYDKECRRSINLEFDIFSESNSSIKDKLEESMLDLGLL